jgi:hypothetical protein
MRKSQSLLILAVLASSVLVSACQDTPGTPPATTNAAVTPAPATTASVTTVLATTTAATASNQTTALSVTSNPTISAPTTSANPTTAPTTTPTGATSAATSPASTQAGSFTLARVEELPIPTGPGTDLYLSPDGRQIFWLQMQKYCFYSAAGQKGPCDELRLQPDPNSVRWSPDSKWIVLTENFYKALYEPDIWVLEVASAKLTNLTDDNITGHVKLGDNTIKYQYDLAPNWTPDSKQVIFLRYEPAISLSDPTLYSIGVAGGLPTKLGLLKSGPGLATFALQFSPDGKQLAYNIASNQKDLPDNGLWLADSKGQNPKQIIKPLAPVSSKEPAKKGPPYDLAFSANGRYLLSFMAQLLGSVTNTWDISSNLIAALDGQEIPVDAANGAHYAAWAPKGTNLAYIVRNGLNDIKNNTNKSGLYVVDRPGDQGRLVQPGEYFPPFRGANWRGLTWASNNTILLMSQGADKFFLVHLDSK